MVRGFFVISVAEFESTTSGGCCGGGLPVAILPAEPKGHLPSVPLQSKGSAAAPEVESHRPPLALLRSIPILQGKYGIIAFHQILIFIIPIGGRLNGCVFREPHDFLGRSC